MLRNYIKTAWRNIIRHKVFAFINVLGLVLGICACIVIYFVTSYDFSFDTFHEDKNSIYRVGGRVQENNGTDFYTSDIPPPAPDGFREEIPGLERVTQYYLYNPKITVHVNGTKERDFSCIAEGSNSTGVIITDSNYFAVFKREWLVGDPFHSMMEPFTVVLSESKARKYFACPGRD